MKKKLMSALLASALVTSCLTGCGGSGDQNATNGTSVSDTSGG